jgi:hypothetical protein
VCLVQDMSSLTYLVREFITSAYSKAFNVPRIRSHALRSNAAVKLRNGFFPSCWVGGSISAMYVNVSWSVHLGRTEASLVICSAQYFSSFHASMSVQVMLMQLATVVKNGVSPA